MKNIAKVPKMENYISLDEDVLPQIEGWSTGETYEVTLKVKMVSKSEGDEYGDGGEDGVRGRFKVVSATGPSETRSDRKDAIRKRLET